MLRSLVLALLVLAPAIAGCLAGPGTPAKPDTVAVPDDVASLRDARFATQGPFSRVLETGPFETLPMERVRFASFDGTGIAAALWRPVLPEGDRAPVILMISPYFGTGLYGADSRTRQFFVEGFVTHGYAFAKVAIRGTSFSSGCMESMGPNEQKDIDRMVTYFGTQPWSNGNVSIWGLSYVGTTPWAAATFGNPHLKAIVPMAGVTSWFDLGFRNGTAEPRTPIHMPLYWANFGGGIQAVEVLAGDDPNNLVENVCPAPAIGLAASQYALATGEMGPFADYWKARDLRARVIENYQGAVFLVHGIRDWNVNIDMSFPFANALVDKGLDVKILLGQWQHSAPDAVSQRSDHLRFDFAEVLLRFFDEHLKGVSRYSGPQAEVEDNLGFWRAEATWPPRDAVWTPLRLGAGSLTSEAKPNGEATLVNPLGAIDGPDCAGTALPGDQAATAAWFGTGPVPEELRFAGLAQLQLTVVPTDARGGEVQAELYHRSGGRLVSRVAHAVMDLRFHDGGSAARTLVPGQPVKAMMEFYGADVAIPKGDELALRVVPDTNLDPCTQARRPATEDSIQGAYIPGPSPAPLIIRWGGEQSVLRLPVIVRDVGDGRYEGQPVTRTGE